MPFSLFASPLVLIYAILGGWLAAFAVFRRVWSRTKAGREWREFNMRMRSKAGPSPSGTYWLLVIAFTAAILFAAAGLRHHFHPGEGLADASGPAVALITVSSYMLAVFPAALLTGLSRWFSPSRRIARDEARVDLPEVTLRVMLLMQAAQVAVVAPICLAQIYAGSFIN